MRGAAAIFAMLVSVAGAAGCGSTSGPGSGGNGAGGNQGIVWLSWTVKGAAVSDAACMGIDHLTLTMQTEAGDLEIEPIPCLRGLGWEYDGLPEGFSVVVLDAFDAQGMNTLEGVTNVTLTSSKPASPAPVSLQPR